MAESRPDPTKDAPDDLKGRVLSGYLDIFPNGEMRLRLDCGWVGVPRLKRFESGPDTWEYRDAMSRRIQNGARVHAEHVQVNVWDVWRKT